MWETRRAPSKNPSGDVTHCVCEAGVQDRQSLWVPRSESPFFTPWLVGLSLGGLVLSSNPPVKCLAAQGPPGAAG